MAKISPLTLPPEYPASQSDTNGADIAAATPKISKKTCGRTYVAAHRRR